MRRFFIGSDWWTDCDDAVAFRVLARAVKAGECEIAGIGINACMTDTAASLTAFLKNEGITLPPIGIDRAATDFGRNPPYQKRLAEHCVPRVENKNLPDAAELCLVVLRESKEPIEIIEIGYPQVLAEVVKTDRELFKNKVSHVWMMAGKWDENPGMENNFTRNDRSRTGGHTFLELCPVPITFLGYEVGFGVLTGGKLAEGDWLRQVLIDHGSVGGRHSWDPMLVELALIGSAEKAGYETVRGTASVDPKTGENRFVKGRNGNCVYVKKTLPNEFYAERIERKIATDGN